MDVGLRLGPKPVLERMLEVGIEDVDGVGVLCKGVEELRGFEELVLEVDETIVDDVESAVITVIVE